MPTNLKPRTDAVVAEVVPSEIEARKVFDAIHEIVHWLGRTQEEFGRKIVRLTQLCMIVRDFRLWMDRICPRTGRRYESFHQWLNEEVGSARSHVYRLMKVRERLALDAQTMEQLGPSRCYRLDQIYQRAPAKAREILERIRSGESDALDGEKFDRTVAQVVAKRERVVWLEVALPPEQAAEIEQALAVENLLEPVEQPDTPWGRGQLLYGICCEFLSGEEQKRVLETLLKAQPRRKEKTKTGSAG
jgi:hypothetical protein